MRKIVMLEHISLDGFLAGPEGDFNWVKLDEQIWDYVTRLQEDADAAIYGAHTFKMMEGYWPTAGDQPDASQHDKDHAAWVNAAQKIVFSISIKETTWANTTFVSGNLTDEVAKLKEQPGKNMLLIGSASLASAFIADGLVDELWLNLNPVLLGEGMSLYKDGKDRQSLKLIESVPFPSGVIGLHYAKA